MTPLCRRCHKIPGHIRGERAMDADGIVIDVQVALCPACRNEADLENEAAKGRRTGKDVQK